MCDSIIRDISGAPSTSGWHALQHDLVLLPVWCSGLKSDSVLIQEDVLLSRDFPDMADSFWESSVFRDERWIVCFCVLTWLQAPIANRLCSRYITKQFWMNMVHFCYSEKCIPQKHIRVTFYPTTKRKKWESKHYFMIVLHNVTFLQLYVKIKHILLRK